MSQIAQQTTEQAASNAADHAARAASLGRSEDMRVIATVSAAHFIAHYYILLLPPLFLFVRDDFGVSYTELGFALAAFATVSAVMQTPAGFLVDRVSPRLVLVAGLLLGAGSFAVVALTHSFWVMVAMFGLAGLGNTAYHPADYALLSHRVSSARVGQAYSIHSFAGFAGTAVAPASLLLMESLFGWRGAFMVSAAMGAAVGAIVLMQRDGAPAAPAAARPAENSGPSGWRLLLSGPILRHLLFFLFLAMLNMGMNGYTVVALNALYGTPVTLGNVALTAYLTAMAIGVLAGGWLTTRTSRHAAVAVICLLVAMLLAVLLAAVDFSTVMLLAVMTVGGFFTGVMVPSRDLLVRESTPPGSFGKVFGFVTNGFNVSGVIAPLIFGLLMDHGAPRLVFLLLAATCLLSALAAIGGRRSAAE